MKTPLDNAIVSQTNTQVRHIPQNSSAYKAPFANIGNDVYFYVSGSKEIADAADPGRQVAVFGGDVVISGSLHVQGCELEGSFNFDCDTLELTGSIDVKGVGKFSENISTTEITTLQGDPFFVAGSGISFFIDSSGQITISSNTSNIEWNEKLSGTTNGSNTTFTMAYTPVSSTTLMIFLNGVLQEPGTTEDFTISGNTVTFNTAPPANSKITATYSR